MHKVTAIFGSIGVYNIHHLTLRWRGFWGSKRVEASRARRIHPQCIRTSQTTLLP